jgi:hypothetical protein
MNHSCDRVINRVQKDWERSEEIFLKTLKFSFSRILNSDIASSMLVLEGNHILKKNSYTERNFSHRSFYNELGIELLFKEQQLSQLMGELSL